MECQSGDWHPHALKLVFNGRKTETLCSTSSRDVPPCIDTAVYTEHTHTHLRLIFPPPPHKQTYSRPPSVLSPPPPPNLGRIHPSQVRGQLISRFGDRLHFGSDGIHPLGETCPLLSDVLYIHILTRMHRMVDDQQ